MGLLVPEDFPMSLLANDEERLVVRALCDRLTDGWLVIPDVGLTGQRDRQMDIVIAHAHEGVAVIEVKGHRVSISGGLWCAHGRPIGPAAVGAGEGQRLCVAGSASHAARRNLLTCKWSTPWRSRTRSGWSVIFRLMSTRRRCCSVAISRRRRTRSIA